MYSFVSSSFHTTACFEIHPCVSFHCTSILENVISSPVGGHLDYYQFLNNVNKVAMNTLEQVADTLSFLLFKCLGVEFWGRVVSICLTL